MLFRSTPPGTLSDADKQFVTHWFPKIEDPATALEPFVSSAASLKPAEQVNFRLVPKETRRFNIGTFGDADTMIGLYEDNGGDPVFIKGDDDSGEDRNALIRVPLVAGRPYILRVRLYSAQASGTFAVMYW